MRQYIGSTRTTLILSSVAVMALAACGDKGDSGALASDSALGRDLAMAQQDSVQPQLQDVPTTPPPEPTPVAAPAPAPKPTPRPTRPAPRPTTTPAPAAPAPTPAPAAAATGTVASGTSMSFATNSKICSNTTAVGEKFTAELTEPVNATNGITIPSGATGTFEVTEAKTAQNSNDNTFLRVRLVSVQYGGKTYPAEATVQTASTERVRSATKGTDAKKVAGGAILGAIAGQVIGKSTKGTVIGAAAGAAAGTAAAAATANFDTCLNTGATISVTLDGPMTVRPLAN
ncbi:hypothetical protein [Gemmatimonas phototrophica]|nr:hypothetical protein [Gemmatimonas phototrophica]